MWEGSVMAPDSSVARDWLRHQVDRLRPKQAEPAASVPPKLRVAVVTDSAAALPPAWVAANSGAGALTIVSMPVIIGQEVFADDDAELESHISLALASGTAVRTSRPSPGQFDRAYQMAADAGFDAVLSLHISAKLSGTFDSAQLAGERAPLKVHVLDSATVGMAQGVGAQAALAVAATGAALEEVLAGAQAAIAGSKVFFYVPSLEQLRRGGRISLASSWVGTMLDIKPLLGIKDGAVVPLEKVRTASKAIARLESMALAEIASRGPGRAQVNLHHFGNEEQARVFSDDLHLAIPDVAVAGLTRLPAVLAAHAGLGVLVVVISDSFIPPQQGPTLVS